MMAVGVAVLILFCVTVCMCASGPSIQGKSCLFVIVLVPNEGFEQGIR